jgi:hypothetical protein
VPYAGRFDGFHAVPASVSKTCLVRFDNNKYSAKASSIRAGHHKSVVRTPSEKNADKDVPVAHA